ncbi:MAG TPA: tetratricopeptide repeat protein, partial [Acidobacteriota bacterium]|nr:tetratricopeptide repeat protein [Acidobacteriota bacterium]
CASAGRGPVAAGPQPVDWAARLAEADALYRAGHYTALRDSRRIYGEALDGIAKGASVAEKYLRTSIAMELRQKDLGVLTADRIVDLDALTAVDPALSRYGPWLELVAGLPNKILGSPGIDQTGGRTLDAQLDWIRTRVKTIDQGLEGAAQTDDLAAALRLTLRREFAFSFEDKLDRKAILGLHPDSRLAAFQAAVCPAFEADELKALLARDPGFSEIHYYLGEEALLAGKLLTAERHYLTVREKIPESLSVLISLAKVAFQMEETETCLAYNEQALDLLPVYRDALLGKGLALGYLGRNDEALTALGRLLELGTYYMGEGHYWTAWNLNELGRLDEARRAIDSAKVFLVGLSDVAALSGIIAYRQGRSNDAEKDLREALDLDPAASDAAYYLGKIYADRKAWLDSGIYFAGAAMTYEDKEKGLENKISEIESSEMSPDRKTRLIARKRAQILSIQATKATCQYNGAAGYHNAGSFERALELARQASAHPVFAEKAAELIKIIQDR